MLSIRKSNYRNQEGFLICGSYEHRGVAVFTKTRTSAELIKQKLLAKEELKVEDFSA